MLCASGFCLLHDSRNPILARLKGRLNRSCTCGQQRRSDTQGGELLQCATSKVMHRQRTCYNRSRSTLIWSITKILRTARKDIRTIYSWVYTRIRRRQNGTRHTPPGRHASPECQCTHSSGRVPHFCSTLIGGCEHRRLISQKHSRGYTLCDLPPKHLHALSPSHAPQFCRTVT